MRIWQKAFPEAVTLPDEIRLDVLARKHELIGADIMNVV